MKYLKIDAFEVCNGTGGAGISLWVQGCLHHCPGCFNPETWDFNGGTTWTDTELQSLKEMIKKPYIKRLTLIGGEPMCHALELSNIASIVKAIKPSIKIWVYSGYTFEQIISDNLKTYLLGHCDVLVDGPYIEELRDLSLPFRGSSNQRIIDIPASLKAKKAIILE